ncbi:MAG: hypothetical protein HW397_511, partial [Dehalococcoidia bacterium]|nr:hypothetical protein [Dehalococcoidia bacterium]
MATSSSAKDEAWCGLADLPPVDREARMTQRYNELAGLEEAERIRRLLAMARAEYALPDEKLREFTMSRLRVLLKLPTDTA